MLYRLSRNDYLNNAVNITEFTFEKISAPDASVQKIIRNGINKFNQSVINDKHSSFTLCVKENENIIGKIVEDGTHGNFLMKNKVYKKLWDAQVGGFLGDETKGETDNEID